jgi:hypothetical protein
VAVPNRDGETAKRGLVLSIADVIAVAYIAAGRDVMPLVRRDVDDLDDWK